MALSISKNKLFPALSHFCKIGWNSCGLCSRFGGKIHVLTNFWSFNTNGDKYFQHIKQHYSADRVEFPWSYKFHKARLGYRERRQCLKTGTLLRGSLGFEGTMALVHLAPVRPSSALKSTFLSYTIRCSHSNIQGLKFTAWLSSCWWHLRLCLPSCSCTAFSQAFTVNWFRWLNLKKAGLASRNNVLNIARWVSLAAVFDFSSFLFRWRISDERPGEA